MKNFKCRIWNGKNKQMIYPSESFEWTISLCGEVFWGMGSSLKDKEKCEILPWTGLTDVDGQDIYEGDRISWSIDLVGYPKRKGKCTVKYYDGQWLVRIDGPFMNLTAFYVREFRIKVIGNKFEQKLKIEEKVKKQ